MEEFFMKKNFNVLCTVLMIIAPAIYAGTGTGESTAGFLTALPPAAPVLSSPLNGQTGIPDPAVISWHKLDHAASYLLQISTEANFGSFAINQANLSDTVYSAQGFNPNTLYNWRVRAVNVAGIGPFSPVWNFTTLLSALEAPTLVSPANGATGVAINAALRWDVVATATSYIVQVSTLPDFSILIFEKNDETGTWCEAAGLAGNTLYFWRIGAVNAGGSSPYSSVWMFTTGATGIAVHESEIIPASYALLPVYPNPFNAGATISWQLPETAAVTVRIYNSMGQIISELAAGMRAAGNYSARWDGCDDQGQSVTSGMYLCKFESGKHVFIKKMLLLR